MSPRFRIEFKDPGFGGHGLAVGGDRVSGLAERVVEKSQIKPGGEVVRILPDHFLQQGFGGCVILFRWRSRPGSVRAERGVINRDLLVTDGLAGFGVTVPTRAISNATTRRPGRPRPGGRARSPRLGRECVELPTLQLRSAGRVGHPPLRGLPTSGRSLLVRFHSGLAPETSCVRIRQLGDGLRRPGAHYVSTPFAALGTEVNHPICCLDYFQIVLDHQNRAPCFN